jgi:centromere protein B
VPKSANARVVQQQETLRDEWTLRHGHQGTSRKRKREDKHPDIEETFNRLFSVVTGRGVGVSGPMLKMKSGDLAKELGQNDFKATDGWLSRWKYTYGIKFMKTHG